MRIDVQAIIVAFILIILVTAVACSSESAPAGPTKVPIDQISTSPSDEKPSPKRGVIPESSTEVPPSATATVDGQETAQQPEDTARLMDDVFDRSLVEVVLDMEDSGNTAYIPVIIDIMRFPLDIQVYRHFGSALASLSGQENDLALEDQMNWLWWVEWLGNHPEFQPPKGYAGWKGRLYSYFDPRIGEFFYDGVQTSIRLDEILWGGVAKDGIPDLTNPPVIAATEAAYLRASDRVFGVSINGEHRAYPLRIMNPHELVNDVLGGVPMALVN